MYSLGNKALTTRRIKKKKLFILWVL